MASNQLKQQLFAARNITITVDKLPIETYGFDGEDLILRVVETLDWEESEHMYYEWTISEEQWENAAVSGNKITVKYDTSAIEIEVWHEMPVDLQEFQDGK